MNAIKALKLEIVLIDLNGLGHKKIQDMLENASYPDPYLCPKVVAINEINIECDSGDHSQDKRDSTFEELLKQLFHPLSPISVPGNGQIYGGYDRWCNLHAWVAGSKRPQYCKYFRPTPAGNGWIIDAPERVIRWLRENCPFEWMKR